MGSGSSRSSQVHSFQIEKDAVQIQDKRLSAGKEKELDVTPSSSSLSQSQSLNATLHIGNAKEETVIEKEVFESREDVSSHGLKNFEAQEKIKSLEKQLTETESQNLDLQERVQMMEERLDYLNSCHQIPEEGENYEETIKAKDQYIAKIEKDQKALQEEINKLKLRHKKRVKNLTRQLNEAKQETSIQMFELKDEITRLREENNRLQDTTSRQSKEDHVPDMGKMQIVLELSNQISDLNDHIANLEKELKDKNEMLKKSQEGVKMEHYNRQKEEISNLHRLSTGLSNFTKEGEFVSDVKMTASEEEFRGISGASRDSGFGSAGNNKRTENNYKPLNHVVKNPPPLSDSDWESEDLPEQFTHSKIHSAPADTISQRSSAKMVSRQSGASSRTLIDSEDDRWSIDDQTSVSSYSKGFRKKKKSSFTSKLRKENETSLRTPVPLNAFGDDLSEFNDIPIYPSNQSTKHRKKKKSSFFLTQGSSPAGSDVSEPVKVK